MESSSQDRNLPASDRKLQKAKDDGQVARSRDLAHLAVLGGGAVSLIWLAPLMFEHLQSELGVQLLFDAQTISDPNTMLTRMASMVAVGVTASAIFAAIVSLIAVASTVAIGGWVQSLTPLTPDFSRVNPLKGFGNMFTKEKFTETLKMSFIAAMLLVVGFTYLSSSLETLRSLMLQPSTQSVVYLSNWLTQGLGLMLLVVLIVAMVDVPLQKFLFKSRMKMSHQEMKQESKESDGNPQMKGHIRQRQRDIAMGNSIKAVPKADFVLMNLRRKNHGGTARHLQGG